MNFGDKEVVALTPNKFLEIANLEKDQPITSTTIMKR